MYIKYEFANSFVIPRLSAVENEDLRVEPNSDNQRYDLDKRGMTWTEKAGN